MVIVHWTHVWTRQPVTHTFSHWGGTRGGAELTGTAAHYPHLHGAEAKLLVVTAGCCLIPWSCRGWPAVSCRSWLWDKVNLFPWNCSVTGVSGWATRLGGPAREASWAILTTSPPTEMQRKRGLGFLGQVCEGYTDDCVSHKWCVVNRSVTETLTR